MAYYKVLHNNKVIDVLDRIVFCKYQLKNKTLILCEEKDAQGILSSTGEVAYHLSSNLPFDVDMYKTVTLEEIDEQEYKRLKLYNLATPEEMAETILLELMKRGVM